MNWLRAALREGKTLWYQSARRRVVQLRLDEPLISITFDDVPLSAVTAGMPILHAFGIHATFYVSLRIDESAAGACLGSSEVRDLHQWGHEIGCHTYRHYKLSVGSAAGMHADAQANRSEIAQLTEGRWPRNFSFPFGELSFTAKRLLAPHYDSLRSSRPGVNMGGCDFNCLRAVSLERDNSTPAHLRLWLEKVERSRGWLILYTHGISDSPGDYDMTPDALNWLLSECKARGLRIVPVFRALDIIAGSVAHPMSELTARVAP